MYKEKQNYERILVYKKKNEEWTYIYFFNFEKIFIIFYKDIIIIDYLLFYLYNILLY